MNGGLLTLCASWIVLLICPFFHFIGVNDDKKVDSTSESRSDAETSNIGNDENSCVFSSLPLAIKWLRDSVQQNQSVRYQVRSMFQIKSKSHILFSRFCDQWGDISFELVSLAW